MAASFSIEIGSGGIPKVSKLSFIVAKPKTLWVCYFQSDITNHSIGAKH